MTIKRYLFLLVTGVILIITIAQLMLLQNFKSNIEQEIDTRGKQFADRIINMTVESLSSNKEQRVKDHVILKPSKDGRPIRDANLFVRVIEGDKNNTDRVTVSVLEFDILFHQKVSEKRLLRDNPDLNPSIAQNIVKIIKDHGHTFSSAMSIEKEGYTIEISPSEVPIKLIKQKLYRHLDKAKANKLEWKQQHNIQPKTFIHDKVKRGHQRSEYMVNMLFNKIFIIIIATAMLSLLLVFWLSRKFTYPLNELIKGFKHLENGEPTVSVEPQGVQEVADTINRFNAMSARLKVLTETEKKLQQQQHLSEVSDVTKGLAHSLRNPLHTIGLLVEQLANANLQESAKQQLINQINKKLKQLDKHISTLLTISTGELDRSHSINLTMLVNDVILELKQSQIAKSSDIKIQLHLPADAKVYGAESELRTIIHTLIFNAFDACLEKGTDGGLLTVSLQIQDLELCIEVNDSGPGIEPSIEKELFNPHISSKPEGAGMGLYISQRIAQLYYNGEISLSNRVENDQIQGATARCCLGIEVNK